MIVASWLVALDPKQARAAREALATAEGRQIKDKQGSRWLVLLTESPEDLDTVRRQLLETPGVDEVDPIASFDDSDPGRDLVRWGASC